MRQLALGLLLASGCTGSITSEGSTPPPTPPATDVQVTVRDGYAAQAGVHVIFQNADASLISDATTDGNGLASATMTAGNVTVIRIYPPAVPPAQSRPAEIFTYVGVKAGDQLQLGQLTSDGTPTAINVKVPDGAQGTVTVMTACGTGQGQPPLVPITVTDCPPDLDFYVADQDNSSFLAHTAFSENVDLSTDTLEGDLAVSLSAINVPTGTVVNIDDHLLAGTLELYSTNNQRVDTQPASVQLPNLQNVDALVVTQLDAPNNGGTELVATRKAYASAPVIVDATAGVIANVTGTPTYSPTGISWLEAGTGDADAIVATLDVTPGVAQGGTPVPNSEYVRVIVAPHTGMSLAMPVLAGSATMYNPSAADKLDGSMGLVGATGGYDALRPGLFAVESVTEATPSGGTFTLSYPSGETPPAY